MQLTFLLSLKTTQRDTLLCDQRNIWAIELMMYLEIQQSMVGTDSIDPHPNLVTVIELWLIAIKWECKSNVRNPEKPGIQDFM